MQSNEVEWSGLAWMNVVSILSRCMLQSKRQLELSLQSQLSAP